MLHRNFDKKFLVEIFLEIFEVHLLIRIFLRTWEGHVNQGHLFFKESDQGVEESLKKVCSWKPSLALLLPRQ